MKFLLTLSFIFINLISYSQEYGTGHELVKLQGATIEFYDGKTLDNSLPEKIITIEDFVQYKCFLKDSLLLKNIYTDITPGLLNRIKYHIEHWDDTPSGSATSLKLGFKFEFIHRGQRLTFIQYTYLKNEEYIKTTASLLVKDGKQWKICGPAFFERLSGKPLSTRIFNRLKPSKLYFLVTGDKSGDSFLDDIIEKTRFRDGFDVGKFDLLVGKWQKDKDQKKLDFFFYPVY